MHSNGVLCCLDIKNLLETMNSLFQIAEPCREGAGYGLRELYRVLSVHGTPSLFKTHSGY